MQTTPSDIVSEARATALRLRATGDTHAAEAIDALVGLTFTLARLPKTFAEHVEADAWRLAETRIAEHMDGLPKRRSAD